MSTHLFTFRSTVCRPVDCSTAHNSTLSFPDSLAQSNLAQPHAHFTRMLYIFFSPNNISFLPMLLGILTISSFSLFIPSPPPYKFLQRLLGVERPFTRYQQCFLRANFFKNYRSSSKKFCILGNKIPRIVSATMGAAASAISQQDLTNEEKTVITKVLPFEG